VRQGSASLQYAASDDLEAETQSSRTGSTEQAAIDDPRS
jgi:hypothetical protein